ncbi:MAG: HD domain-containing protein [Pseudomonadota bacterium]
MSYSPRVLDAAFFAAQVHAGHRGRDGEIPLINHVLEVASLVANDNGPEEAVIAALLHGVIEDSEITADELSGRFGDTIAETVQSLTEKPEWQVLDGVERKKAQALHISTTSTTAQQIKLADRICNARDMRRFPLGQNVEQVHSYCSSLFIVIDECRAAAPSLARIFDEENLK